MDINQVTIEQMAATLAHEVKNPISVVKACLDLLELENPENKEKNSYKIMRRELDKINDIMIDFMQLLKPSEAKCENIVLSELLDAVIDNSLILSKNEVRFVYTSSNSSVKICGDKAKLSRAFFNIYKNAIEALSSDGEISTTLTKEGNSVTICVSDNGIGLSADVKDKIINPFFSTKENGNGLGVFICKSIIEEHGGTFEIDGGCKGGCCVTVTLPLADD